MKSSVRGALALAAVTMLVAAAGPLSAQARDKEIRLDFLGLETSSGNTVMTAGFPGSLAFGIYMNQHIAIEPQIGLAFRSGNGFSGSVLSAGLFVPYYFKGDTGRSGFFLSPGLSVSKGFGDFAGNSQTDYGVDLGLKMTHRERVSTRIALTIRDGDSSAEAVIGATFGVGLFWR